MRRHLALAALLLSGANLGLAAPLPDELLQTLQGAGAVDVIVELDASAIDRGAATRRARLPRRIDDDAALASLASRYRTLKDQAMRPLQRPDIDLLLDYSHLPLRSVRVRSEAALRALAARPGVRALHADRLHQRVLTESLPLIGQPAVAAAGLRGAGATVAVIDDGIELTQSAFGGCTAVGTPASCRIAALQTFVANPGADAAHGTNVSAIVIGVAPDARIASLNVFTATGAPSSAIISAINWAIANRSSFNIVSINMSLGDSSHNVGTCSGSVFAGPIANARNAGISVVVAAGNNAYDNGAYVEGLSAPACAPQAVSVGAVYDQALGGLAWSGGTATACTDGSTAADQVTCFSNAATYLSLLAPGALINAGGYNFGGTSQAAPHAAGALAVLRRRFTDETLAAVETRLTANGTPITDPRTGRTHPRLNLLASARPRNDAFANAIVLSGASGSTTGSNRLATHEAGEPQPMPAANASVWWRWTAPAAGQVSLDTVGSGFDTRLDVYSGNAVSALGHVAGNDNADAQSVVSALRFQAQAGATYSWAVDSADGSAGDVSLNWSLNTTAQANLSVTLSGPSTAPPGSTVSYTLTIANAGPQSATGVSASVALPRGVTVASLPAACAAPGTTIVCTASEIPSGTSLSYTFSVQIGSLASAVSLSASLSSEVPDPVASDNTATVVLSPSASGSADVPTLPEWAVLLLGGVLIARMAAGERPLRSAPRGLPTVRLRSKITPGLE